MPAEQGQPSLQAATAMTARPHPERFDPAVSANTLMDSEHRGRYRWAAQFVPGRATLDAGCGTGYGLEILAEAGATGLTGVDLDPAALAAAQPRAESCGARVSRGDLQELEFPDDSFDVVICLETIEHLASPERGIAELRRVIRPGGTLLVSSPNPDVYPAGNEHHRHELRPDELRRLVEGHFPIVRVYLQHAWLASIIEPADADRLGEEGASAAGALIQRSNGPEPNGTTFAVVVGSDGEEEGEELAPLLAIGDAFEVGWWEDRVEEAKQDAEARLAEQELESARALSQLQAQNAQIAEQLREASSALVDANQELAQLPLLKHRLAEMYARNASLQSLVDTLMGSRSWQVTGFLRRLAAMLKLR